VAVHAEQFREVIPDPIGTTPSAASVALRSRPLATSWTVPSPPTAIT